MAKSRLRRNCDSPLRSQKVCELIQLNDSYLESIDFLEERKQFQLAWENVAELEIVVDVGESDVTLALNIEKGEN